MAFDEQERTILELLEKHPKGLAFNQLFAEAQDEIGSRTTLTKKLEHLMKDRQVSVTDGPRGSNIYQKTRFAKLSDGST